MKAKRLLTRTRKQKTSRHQKIWKATALTTWMWKLNFNLTKRTLTKRTKQKKTRVNTKRTNGKKRNAEESAEGLLWPVLLALL